MRKHPRCKNCRTKKRPLRWRALFDNWFCPKCEYAHAKAMAERLAREIERELRNAEPGTPQQ